jgi:hypothetical protein
MKKLKLWKEGMVRVKALLNNEEFTIWSGLIRSRSRPAIYSRVAFGI